MNGIRKYRISVIGIPNSSFTEFPLPELRYTAIPEENNSEITVYRMLALRYTAITEEKNPKLR